MQQSRATFDRHRLCRLRGFGLVPAATLLAAATISSSALCQTPPAGSGGNGGGSGVTIVLSENERADKLHLEGKALLAENKWDEALPKLREAYALKQSYDIASNLAWTLSALEQHVEAARLLCDAKDKLPTVIEPEKRTVFNNVYNDARSRSGIARVEVEGSAEFNVLVDGEVVEGCGRDRLIIVEPGEHEIVAEHDGRRTDVETHNLKAGAEEIIQLGPLRDGDDGGGDGMLIGGAVVAGLGGAALIVGGVLFGVSNSAKSDWEQLADNARADGIDCAPVSPGAEARCAELVSKGEDAESLRSPSIAMMAIGGGLAALGTALLIASSVDDDEPTSNTAFDVWVGDGAGATLRFSW